MATDEIYEKYLQKAITESNALGDELAQAAGGARVPVLGSGHPLADVFLLKYAPQASELQEYTPTIQGLVTPDIDESLDEQPAKTAFWNAFKVLGEWWSQTPPY